jgi:hypothetical protein
MTMGSTSAEWSSKNRTNGERREDEPISCGVERAAHAKPERGVDSLHGGYARCGISRSSPCNFFVLMAATNPGRPFWTSGGWDLSDETAKAELIRWMWRLKGAKGQ